ncbi:hypothetical protein [Hymenobacter guriensis]|uniref:DUF6311 domain-containing protein n=1 Tax=Hymenobacter guriensis TaxID=2793065 RepID=A0ABS0L366_9BACT|nr:hypothetical protein [Hymenobacter guriensis]MBG8554415.1 hypothetical protein [Hymenobacter guriensis]
MRLIRFPVLRRVAAWHVLLLLLAIWLAWEYSPVLLAPDKYMSGSEGDSVKNYYTVIYHALYGKGLHFQGMLHPFGEHVVYADGQPLLSIPLATLRQLGINYTAGQLLGLQNLLLLGCVPATALVLYAVLRRCWLPPWWAAAGALLLTLMAPQFERALAHYALAYAFIIPLLWYLLLRATETRLRWGWLLAYVAAATLAGLLHPYYVPTAALLSGAHALLALIQWRRRGRYALSIVGWLLLATVVPVILFQGWMALTDAVTDRPATPFGFLVYRATFSSVWFPIYEPLATGWRSAFHNEEPLWEGWSYVGLVPGLVLVLSGWRVLRYLVRGHWRLILRPALPPALQRGIWAGVLVLLFASGMPFVFGLEHWLNYLPPLRQFRSIGRFAWVFYYIWGAYAVFYLYQLTRYLRQHRVGALAVAPLVLLGGGWLLEGYTFSHLRANRIVLSPIGESFTSPRGNYPDLLSWAHRRPEQFQAILPLPLYLVGGEGIGLEGTRVSEWESMRASLATGLPLHAAMLSRTSRHQMLSEMQLLGAPWLPRELISALPSAKPLLVLVTGAPEHLRPAEQQLLARARHLLTVQGVQLYELPVAAMAAEPARQAVLTRPRPAGPHLRPRWPGRRSPLGDGVITGTGLTVLYRGPFPPPDSAGLEVSAWLRLTDALPVLQVRELNAAGQPGPTHDAFLNQLMDLYQGWGRAAVRFRLAPDTRQVEIVATQDSLAATSLLLRPASTPVVDTLGRQVLYNNYPLHE